MRFGPRIRIWPRSRPSGAFWDQEAIEVRVVRTHMDERILSDERKHHVDPDKWRPLIMSFCEFYSLGENLHPSRLAKAFDG